MSRTETHRKAVTIRFDPLVWEGIEKKAKLYNISASRMVENIVFDRLKQDNDIPPDTEHLGETRGGAAIARRKANEKNNVL